MMVVAEPRTDSSPVAPAPVSVNRPGTMVSRARMRPSSHPHPSGGWRCARRRRIHPKTLGADKGYHVKDFVQHLREHNIRPHIARIEGRKTPGLDGRTTRTEGYKISQRKRKRIEEIFGWLKTVGGMRKTRFIGEARTQIAAYLSAAAYNLLRIAKLQTAGGAT